MALVKPFRAVRYNERRAGPLSSLVAPPYDAIARTERERYLAASPYNVVRLIVPDSEQEAGRLYADWTRQGVLVRENEPALWWVLQEYKGPDGRRRAREGFFAAVRLAPYSAGAVRPHERTYEASKASQLRLLRAVRASLSPILLIYDDDARVSNRALAPLAGGPPALQAADHSSTMRVWRITDPDAIGEVTAALAERTLLIADGHHRYETALAFHEEDGSPESAYTMAVLVNGRGEGLTIFPTHRVVRRLPELNGGFRVTPVSGGPEEALCLLQDLAAGHPAFVLYRAGQAILVEAPGAAGLDTALLERLPLEGVSYTPFAREAVARVDAGEAEGAFLLRAPTIEQVAAVAAAGETMPQKSTYFYPKLLSGLLFLPV